MRPTGILGIGYAVPDGRLTNIDLEKMVDTSDEWITTRTGIKERRIAAEGEATSDWAVKAAEKALSDARGRPRGHRFAHRRHRDGRLDGAVHGQHRSASTGHFRRGRLRLGRGLLGLRLRAGSSVARGALGRLQQGSGHRRGLAEPYRQLGRPLHVRVVRRRGGRRVVGETSPEYGVLATYLGSDGSGAESLIIPAGGSRKPADR